MLIDKLRKINELALRGEDGERENANRLLEQLLDQYNLTRDDLLNEKVERRVFLYDTVFESQFLMNIIESVNNRSLEFILRYGGKALYVDLTDVEYIQTEEVVKYYKKIYKKQLREYKKSLLVGILNKYNLISPFANKEEKEENKKKKSKKNQINWAQVFSLIGSIKEESYLKKLTN